MKHTLSLLLCCLFLNSWAQTSEEKTQIQAFFDQALTKSMAYEDLRVLCKDIGARLSGSKALEQAVVWGDTTFQDLNPDTVYKQEVLVPHWERGREQAHYYDKNGRTKLKVKTLGGSVGTGLSTLQGSVIQFNSLTDLENADPKTVEGKFVFLNQPFDETYINTFDAYGACSVNRFMGAIKAAEKGAIAIYVRSLSNHDNKHAHTGSMAYKTGLDSIPAVALSAKAANILALDLANDPTLTAYLKLQTTHYQDARSHNVIAELKGSQFPDQYITIGAHLDSWDVGEGAHDDGAGVVQTIEVLRLFKTMTIQPKHSIRFVLFTNEENGAKGAFRYAQLAELQSENHILAIESDRGGFSPRGFQIDSKNTTLIEQIRSWKPFLEQFGLHDFSEGYAGVDINPLKSVNQNITLIGLKPDSQRYFSHHHADSDVFESVNRRELELGAASMAALLYLLDKNL
ncbi:MAG: M20/M25/M40 family metallo-hydrolase [Flavobacteriales bacterium]